MRPLITVLALGDRMFARVMRAIGREDLLSDLRFRDQASRAEPEYGALLHKAMEEWIAQRPLQEVEREAFNLPYRCPSGTLAPLLTHYGQA